MFERLNAAFCNLLQSSRGPQRGRMPALEAEVRATPDDMAMRRARGVKPQRMIIPEGVTVNGSMISRSDTELSGRVDGDLAVEGDLYLGAGAHVAGNVRARSCKVEGLVEGKMECTQDLELGQTSRLNADALAGRNMTLAGQVSGNVFAGGLLRLLLTARVTGDIHAKTLVMEEGAVFNGTCTMRSVTQRSEK
jgi:cytoskeletal protein CcmA (bactofilin family)